MPLNRACLGKEYPPVITAVTTDAIAKYARACNENNPRYFDTASAEGIVAPPMFAAVVAWVPVVTAMTDPELRADLLRLLHTAQEMEFLGAIRPGDQISARARVAEIGTASGGEFLTLALEAQNQRREMVNRTRFTVLIRGRRSQESKSSRAETPPGLAEPIAHVTQTIDRDQTYRYAEASGDVNPIHVNEGVAKMAGLPGIIVHGLCTMAFAARAVIESVCNRDPRRLKRLSVNFARPVFPGDSIITSTRRTPDGQIFHFDTVRPDGAIVIRGGVAELAR